MPCPSCGHAAPFVAGRCTACGADVNGPVVATTLLPIDTTGLPPGATFGASAEVPTAGSSGFAADSATAAPTADSGSTTSPAGPLANEGPLVVGQSFGPRYHVIRLLGVGGMGAVYQAWDAELGVAVALKVIRVQRQQKASAALEKRFKNELLLARQVTHKNVVRIHDLGEIDGIKYITMPYVQGKDLATLLRREGKLPIGRALSIARQLADGLRAAHDAGVLHRDLKPANIMISTAAEEIHALIMDFGISSSAGQVASGTVLGTLEYMPPEQATGEAFDARADIYAFGLILYEMLTGPRMVASADSASRLTAMRQRFSDGMVPVRMLDPSVPRPVEALVMRCVHNNPAERIQTSGELCAALAALDDAGEIIPEPTRLTPRMLAAAALVVALLLGGTYFATRKLVAPPRAHEIVSVLIADFENTSGDPVFDGSIEQALGVALEGASYITVFKSSAARAIAAQLGKGQNTRITDEVGQLIAHREGIKVLVGGAINRRGDSYRLELRAADAATGNTIAAASQTAKSKADVLKMVDSLAVSVRKALGESNSEMAKVAAGETVTAASLDAMRAYARGQEFLIASRFQDALQEYQRAVALDPQFGRAYAGIAGIYANYFKEPDKARASYQTAMQHLDRMTEREKYRTLGTYYVDVAQNYEKAIENYETLVRLYPADDGGHGNLALAYVLVGNIPRAVTEVRKSLDIYPRNSLQRYNYAMYSMYAGDFETAIKEASRVQEENPSLEYAWLPVALSKLAQNDVAAARDAYSRLAAMSPVGASLAKLGQSDLEMYFGRPQAAIAILTGAIDVDRKQGSSTPLAQKYAVAAEAYAALGDRKRASAAAAESIGLTQRESTAFPSAIVLLRFGREEAALQAAAGLEKMLQRQTTAYARLISAEATLARGRTGEAIEIFRDAQKRYDSWLGRFLLGRAYVNTEHYPEAFAELELCLKRRGEANDVFFYDQPTIRYLPPLYYWLGRAQEGLGASAEARKYYEQFLALRADAAPPDPLAVDARRRISAR